MEIKKTFLQVKLTKLSVKILRYLKDADGKGNVYHMTKAIRSFPGIIQEYKLDDESIFEGKDFENAFNGINVGLTDAIYEKFEEILKEYNKTFQRNVIKKEVIEYILVKYFTDMKSDKNIFNTSEEWRKYRLIEINKLIFEKSNEILLLTQEADELMKRIYK